MPNDDGDTEQADGGTERADADTEHHAALEVALGDALAGLPGADRPAGFDPAASRWLGIGMRLGLERPGEARHLLALIRAPGADPAEAPRGEAPSTVPVPSSLLARAAALPLSDRASRGPEVTFGWAAGLTRGEILSLGRVVGEMLAEGSPPDIGRGYGLTWDDGVRLPRQELDAMFREFTELEVIVGSVLAGRDLRADEPDARSRGLGTMLGFLAHHPRPGESQAAAMLASSGEPGRRGLVALWNAWVAMCYRSRIAAPTFELLVRPWTTVVGPIPEA